MPSESMAIVIDRVCARQARSIFGTWVGMDRVEGLYRLVASDRQAFPTAWSAWAFIFSVAPSVRLARESIEKALRDEARLGSIARDLRAISRRMDRHAIRQPSRLDEVKQLRASPLPRGRKNETDLRDFVVQGVRRQYPSNGEHGAAWRVAIDVAGLVWPRVRHMDLKRDTRRRYRRVKRAKSRAFSYYCLDAMAGAFGRILRESTTAVPPLGLN